MITTDLLTVAEVKKRVAAISTNVTQDEWLTIVDAFCADMPEPEWAKNTLLADFETPAAEIYREALHDSAYKPDDWADMAVCTIVRRQFISDCIDRTQRYTDKRRYNTDLMLLESYAETLQQEIDYLIAKFENEDDMTAVEALNPLHDEAYAIQEEIRSLERRWGKRNWTYQDHAFYDLVMQNID